MLGVPTTYTGRADYRTPGVYYEERTAPLPFTGALRTGVPAFLGFAELREADARRSMPFRHLNRWVNFDDVFATPFENTYLAYAVRGFYENGGEHCVVVPVHAAEHSPAALTEALIEPFKQGGVLENLEDIDLVCVPDATALGIGSDPAAVFEIQSKALEHCQRMGDRFAILDVLPGEGIATPYGEPPGGNGIPSAIQHWQALPPSHGALYYPWIYVTSHRPGMASTVTTKETAGDRAKFKTAKPPGVDEAGVPPCGHIAGVYARTDLRVGVHKAPANETVEGALRLATELSDGEQADLNESGVNCLRDFPGRGIRVWGARTLSGLSDWRYVNVDRLFLTLTRWLKQNTNDFVFEPHNPQLWDGIRRRVSGYCRELFDRGALKGRSPDEAFFVKCDAETNPVETRLQGLVIAEVGLAAVLPAEFVVVRITQSASKVAVTGVAGS